MDAIRRLEAQRARYAAYMHPVRPFALLPDELVAAVLAFLPLRDLRRAAAVSRRFYTAAWASGLYFQRTLGDSTDATVEDQLEAYSALLQHALTKDLRLSVRLEWPKYDSADDQTKSKALDTLRLVADSMPLLVSLSIKASSSLFPEIWNTLRHSAPRLRCFQLECITPKPPTTILSYNDMFGGTAPRLCELRLTGVALGAETSSIFANVVRLSLSYRDDSPELAVFSSFPRLSELILVCSSLDREIPPRSIDLRGVTLRKLVLRETKENAQPVAFAPYFKGPELPECQHIRPDSIGMDWSQPLGWQSDGGELNINISSRFGVYNIVVVSADLSRRRTYTIQDCAFPTHPLVLLPNISARMTYLRIAAVDVQALLNTRAQYSALTRVRIDVLCRDGAKAGSGLAGVSDNSRLGMEHQSGVVRVRCPALRTLSLLAAPLPGSQSPPRGPTCASVEADDVAFVCRALGPSAKLELELGGVAVENRISSPSKSRQPKHAFLKGTPFERAVASVRYVKFPDPASCAVFGEKNWLDDPALLEDDYLPRSIPRLESVPRRRFDDST